jgi:manganese/iron transport system permease protein
MEASWWMNAARRRKPFYDATTSTVSTNRGTTMLEWLIDPLTYGFMQRGLMASVIVGILCAVIGCYVVLRSMAFLGDALAHAILPGVAIAYLLGGNLLIGALIAAVLVALGIGFFSQQGSLREDTAIGILFAAALSLGVVLISSIKTYAVDLTHILFGNILGVSVADLWLTGILSLFVLGTILLLYKEFLVITFDPVLAATLRLPAQLLRNLMLILLSLTVVVSLQTVGVGLVVAMLVTPGATAYLLTRRLPSMMLVSAGLGVISSLVGLYFSYYANVASGAAIVLTATMVFLLVFLLAPQRGIIWQRLRATRSLSQ